ncbi:hypothetical protein [Rhodanobacter sp. L36]|uniref:hypothetical protein n=1 Tax=Rhodanobacter sp. L36 TaxID=1747221 RepID=UPI0020B10915|nr:hypothetical protein [Rhodanobacter sp. L36]
MRQVSLVEWRSRKSTTQHWPVQEMGSVQFLLARFRIRVLVWWHAGLKVRVQLGVAVQPNNSFKATTLPPLNSSVGPLWNAYDEATGLLAVSDCNIDHPREYELHGSTRMLARGQFNEYWVAFGAETTSN